MAADASAQKRVSVLGSGSFGSVLARIVCKSVSTEDEFDSQVRWWVRREALAEEVRTRRTNSQYLGSECLFPDNVSPSTDLTSVVADADVVVLAIPHEFLPDLYPVIKASLKDSAQVVSAVKSLRFDADTKEITPMTLHIQSQLGVPTSILAGPNIYTEMAKDEFAEATIGCSADNHEGARLLQSLFNTETFRVEVTNDVVGVDLCAALKNCITLACGYCAGLGLGMNVKAAVIRAGHREIQRFASSFFEVQAGTFNESCGVGDLLLSCTVGRGQRLAAAFVKAGGQRSWQDLEDQEMGGMRIPDWHNIQAVHAFLDSRGALASFPLLSATFSVGFEGAPASSVVDALRVTAPPPVPQSLPIPTSPNTIDFQGQKALVVGGAGGIGKAIVKMLLRCNAEVTVMDLFPEALEALRKECAPHALHTLQSNLSDVDEAMAQLAVECAASGPYPLLVHTAGLAKFEPIFQTSSFEFDRQYHVNVRPNIFLTQVVAEDLAKRGAGGSVVHISSQSSTLAILDHVVYSSSKAAVDHVSRIQALELGKHNIRVNTVRPTVVMTPLAAKAWDPEKLEVMKNTIPLKKLAEPDDVARATVWLLSEESSMVTGASIPVDGGRSMGGLGL